MRMRMLLYLDNDYRTFAIALFCLLMTIDEMDFASNATDPPTVSTAAPPDANIYRLPGDPFALSYD